MLILACIRKICFHHFAFVQNGRYRCADIHEYRIAFADAGTLLPVDDLLSVKCMNDIKILWIRRYDPLLRGADLFFLPGGCGSEKAHVDQLENIFVRNRAVQQHRDPVLLVHMIRGDDAAGKMVSKKTTTKEKYKYDKKGRRKTCTIYENGKKTNKLVYSYDKKGRESGFKNYNKKGKLISTTTIKYNSKGLTKSVTTKYKDGETKTLKDTYSYKYYSGKKIKKQTIKSSDGSKFVVEYNKKGRKTRSTNTGEGYKTVYYYNSKGLVTKMENKSDNSSSVMVYTYDKNGHKTKGVETWTITNNGKKTKDTTTYTYKIKVDKNGNVISEIEYIGKDPMRKTEYGKYKKFTYTVK